MNTSFRKFQMLVVILALLMGSMFVSAQQPIEGIVFTEFTPTCTQVSVDWFLNDLSREQFPDATVELYIDSALQDATFGYAFGFDHTFTYKELATGDHTILIEVYTDPFGQVPQVGQTRDFFDSISETISCGEDEEPVVTVPSDGRICFAPGQAPAAVYLYGDGTFDVYAINENDDGELVIRMTRDELDELPGEPEQNLVVEESNRFVRIQFIRLSTGENQINVGPEPVWGKVWECVFDSKQSTVTDWFAF